MYLGVQIHARLSFDRYLHLAGKKVAHIISTLSWIMTNVGGPRTYLASIVTCVLICCSHLEINNDDEELCLESNCSIEFRWSIEYTVAV